MNKKAGSKATEWLEELLRIMEEEGLSELEVADGTFRVKLVKQSAQTAVHAYPPVHQVPSPSKPAAAKEPEYSGTPVKSPIAGVFYRSPSPKSPPYVSEGDVVKPGQILCIVEAMKVMNEITSTVAGRVSKIMIENGKSVEANQVILVVTPV